MLLFALVVVKTRPVKVEQSDHQNSHQMEANCHLFLLVDLDHYRQFHNEVVKVQCENLLGVGKVTFGVGVLESVEVVEIVGTEGIM